ncbi:MAG: hypothetical protein NTY50_22750 [Methylobacter sp.]|nr:hypothetical protein [Methylobacter sp.]
MNTLNGHYTRIHNIKGGHLLWKQHDYFLNSEDPPAAVMTPRELTQQAFKLYEEIRLKSANTPVYLDLLVRLHSVQLQAFLRYKRRLKAERCSLWKLKI